MATDTEKLFEELMEYHTSFNSVDEINSKTDLKEYFRQLSEQAKSSKQKKQFTSPYSNTRQALLDGWNRIKKSGKTIVNRHKQDVIKSTKRFKTFEDARRFDAIIVNTQGKQIYKTEIIIKGKKSERWRDAKGRFVSKKSLESE